MRIPHVRASCFVLCLVLFAGQAGFGQAAKQEGVIGHPQDLRVWYEGSSVHLTWQADLDQAGGYVVYRSALPPSEADLPDAVLVAELPPEAREYSDGTSPEGLWYYFVLSLGVDGQSKPFFELAQNTTRFPLMIPRKTGPDAQFPEAETDQGKPPAEAAEGVARTAPDEGDSPGIAQRDSPLPTYVYPGIPSLVPPRRSAGPGEASLTADSQGAVDRLLDGAIAGTSSRPDLVLPPGGEDPAWEGIRKAVEEGNWARAKEGATRIAAAAAKPGTGDPDRARLARWFLGISLTGLGSYREALYELIPTADIYPRETKPWIDYAILRLAASRP